MADTWLDEARAQQRRTLRSIPDSLLSGWRPPNKDVPLPPSADRPFVEMALRQAADEVAPGLDPFFGPAREVAYVETATATIQARSNHLSFKRLLGSLAQTRLVALDQLQRLRLDDEEAARWVHLVVWADELADDGYRDPRLE